MRRLLLLPLIALAAGCPLVTAPSEPSDLKFDHGQLKGIWYLDRDQSKDDGTWRSDIYATFKDGTALTPLVVSAHQDSDTVGYSVSSRRRGVEFLTKRVKPDRTIDEGTDGLPYPVYTAALTVQILHHPEFRGDRTLDGPRKAWLKYLLDRQLTETNGWTPVDGHYGGWGYYPLVPKKPAPGQAVPAQHLLESNLSATTFALDALRAAGHDDPEVYRKARRFVLTCRNDDGGFHFIYDDPVRNKAGAEPGPDGKPRFHSYGSTTADGARALLLCGDKPDSPEVVAARAWLTKHFTPDRHPGTYVPAHEPNRNAVYFYYARSVAKTFRLLGVTEVNGRHWAESLSESLLARQRDDGSWANPVELVRENDPVVATAYAVSALAECRTALPK